MLEKHNASTAMLGLKEVWNKIMNQRTETYYKAIQTDKVAIQTKVQKIPVTLCGKVSG